MLRLQSSNRLLPIAVEDPTPTTARAIFINEATGDTLAEVPLKQNGSELFLTPPTHVFEIGRYREETMAFPPSVTIKDYTWAGSAGYPNPKRGAEPERFATVIQIVPSPPGTPQ